MLLSQERVAPSLLMESLSDPTLVQEKLCLIPQNQESPVPILRLPYQHTVCQHFGDNHNISRFWCHIDDSRMEGSIWIVRFGEKKNLETLKLALMGTRQNYQTVVPRMNIRELDENNDVVREDPIIFDFISSSPAEAFTGAVKRCHLLL